jgi:hypothetical protein
MDSLLYIGAGDDEEGESDEEEEEAKVLAASEAVSCSGSALDYAAIQRAGYSSASADLRQTATYNASTRRRSKLSYGRQRKRRRRRRRPRPPRRPGLRRRRSCLIPRCQRHTLLPSMRCCSCRDAACCATSVPINLIHCP